MPTPTILIATWGNGLFGVTGNKVHQELADQPVRSLTADGHGRVLSQLLARIRSADDPRTANGGRSQKANSSFHAACQLGTLFLLEPTTRKSFALILTARSNDWLVFNP